MFSKSELEGLGRDELVQLAEDHGHTVKARATKGDLIDMLTGQDSLEEKPESDQSEDHQSEDQESESDAEKVSSARKKERVKIIVHSDANDASNVKVGVNGRMYLIKRDVEVEVPREVVNVLERAVKTRLEPVRQREDGSMEYRERHSRRFAFDIRG